MAASYVDDIELSMAYTDDDIDADRFVLASSANRHDSLHAPPGNAAGHDPRRAVPTSDGTARRSGGVSKKKKKARSELPKAKRPPGYPKWKPSRNAPPRKKQHLSPHEWDVVHWLAYYPEQEQVLTVWKSGWIDRATKECWGRGWKESQKALAEGWAHGEGSTDNGDEDGDEFFDRVYGERDGDQGKEYYVTWKPTREAVATFKDTPGFKRWLDEQKEAEAMESWL